MKLILALFILTMSLVVSSFAYADDEESPSISTSIDANQVITLNLSNNITSDLKCHYSVSWLVNVLTYKRQSGDLLLPASGVATVTFTNDKFDHISRIHTSVTCE